MATIEIGREFDLVNLSTDLSNSEYEPEHSPFLVYRPEGNPTLLVASNGLISGVGAKNMDDIEGDIRDSLSELNGLGIDLDDGVKGGNVQNIVVKGDFNLEFDLNAPAVGIVLSDASMTRSSSRG